MQFVPRTGPLSLDCRACDASGAVLRVRMLVKKVRKGARRLDVRVNTPATIDAVSRWARRHRAPHAVEATEDGWLVTVFLLPDQFGEPPGPSLREGACGLPGHLLPSIAQPAEAPATAAA